MRPLPVCLSLALASLAGVSTAAADPTRVVVLDFDGPPALAGAGRAAVIALVSDRYDLVATQRWQDARAQATGHGPEQWRQAAKQAGVDAVLQGWVQGTGRHHALTVEVCDATSGRDIDTITVELDPSGLSRDSKQQLAGRLADVFGFVDGDLDRDSGSTLPDVRTLRRHRDDDDGDRRDDRAARDDQGDHDERDARDDHDDRDARVDHDDRDADAHDDRDGDHDAPRQHRDRLDASPVLAAVADRASTDDGATDLVSLFGPTSKEAAIVSDNQAAHVPQPTPRFSISGGAYLASRGMSFENDPNSVGGPPTYPASSITGLSVDAAIYPAPLHKVDGDLSGIGFTLRVAHSLGSTLTAMDDTGYGDYTVDQTAWEAGIHYRYPLGLVTIDGGLAYGNLATSIVDLPQSIQIPDTAYSYLGAGGTIDLAVTSRASVGFGAQYMYMLDAGDVTSEDWYGAGKAWGMALEGHFQIPLPGPLFIRGEISYRKEHIDFEGSGTLTMQWGVWDMDDSSIAGGAQLGVRF